MLPNRLERVAEAIQEHLANIILQDVKDPGIPQVFTITRVDVTRDLRIARVRFSQLPDDPEAIAATEGALDRARGYLRRELGARMSLKYLPALEFFHDPSPAHAQRIDTLLHSIRGQTQESAPSEEEEREESP